MAVGGILLIAQVMLWGRRIAAVSMEEGRPFATFQYEAEFVRSGIQVSPFTMPLRPEPYEFPELPTRTFKGLPGLLADSLPDKFGDILIDTWLAREGRQPESFSILERLCYVGTRGMGALEYKPARGPKLQSSNRLDVGRMVELASKILSERSKLQTTLVPSKIDQGLLDILRVGTSAGGARAKAVIAWNPKTDEVRSGQVRVDPEFEYWLIKFDGVRDNSDKELADPEGFGAIEYAYSVMAKQAGINMAETRLLAEGGRRHFMTKRFDRLPGGEKLHMQSLGGMLHYDFNQPRAYSYEQSLAVIRQLQMGTHAMEEQFRRMVFNVVARKQDDHVKNIAYLMDQKGTWTLSPAFDVNYSYNPTGDWTSTHQMTIGGEVDHFTRENLLACGKSGGIGKLAARQIIEQVNSAVNNWPHIATSAKIPEETIRRIQQTHRLDLL